MKGDALVIGKNAQKKERIGIDKRGIISEYETKISAQWLRMSMRRHPSRTIGEEDGDAHESER